MMRIALGEQAWGKYFYRTCWNWFSKFRFPQTFLHTLFSFVFCLSFNLIHCQFLSRFIDCDMWLRRSLTRAWWRIKRWCRLYFVHHSHFLSFQKSALPRPIHRWGNQLILFEFRFDGLCTSVKLFAVDISDRACLFWISFTPGGICAASDAGLGRWLEVETVLGHLA